jgi:ABC-type multidrug transport system ATPase subunit
VESLQLLTCSQRTILCTIHQPSTAVFERFDKLLLLSAGYPLYFGPIKKCRAHFEGLGFNAGVGGAVNPAEFVIAAATEMATDPLALEQNAHKALSHAHERDRETLALSQMPPSGLGAGENQSGSGVWESLAKEMAEIASSGPIIFVLLKREAKAMTRRSFFLAVSIRTALTGVLIG